ncbi:MAG: hypothetical protein IJO40_08255 [Thermoguttaceae bacterium]|nr:hypothetical protein [Thermoguttaceae bacterium]
MAELITLTDYDLTSGATVEIAYPNAVVILDTDGNNVTAELYDSGALVCAGYEEFEGFKVYAHFTQSEATFVSEAGVAYAVEYSEDAGNWTRVATLEGDGTRFTTLVDAKAKYWRVVAVDAEGSPSQKIVKEPQSERLHIFATYDDVLSSEYEPPFVAVLEILAMSEYFVRGETPKIRLRLNDSSTDELVVAARLSKILYTIYKLGAKYSGERIKNAVPGHANVEIPLSCVKESCIVDDPRWTKDEIGYNVLYVVDGSQNVATPDAGDYVLEITIIPLEGDAVVTRQEFSVK